MHCVQGQNCLFLTVCNNLLTSEKLMYLLGWFDFEVNIVCIFKLIYFWFHFFLHCLGRNRVLLKCSAQMTHKLVSTSSEKLTLTWLTFFTFLKTISLFSRSYFQKTWLLSTCIVPGNNLPDISSISWNWQTYFHRYAQNIIAKTKNNFQML